MKQARRHRRVSAGVLAGLVLLGGAGCGSRTQRLDARDEGHPLLRRAQARKRANDVDAAIALYLDALQRKPDLARAHLELGLLFDHPKEDYVRAVYHYQRYLELRPDAEKKDLVLELVRNAKLAYAASLPEKPSGAVQAIAELQKENARLRGEILQLREQAAAPAASLLPARAAPRGTPPPPPAPPAEARGAAPAAGSYLVQRGDTLFSIAARLYGDAGQWRKIYEANKVLLADPGSVRPGQTLQIPR